MIIILNRASNGRKYFTVVVFTESRWGFQFLLCYTCLSFSFICINELARLSISNLLKLKTVRSIEEKNKCKILRWRKKNVIFSSRYDYDIYIMRWRRWWCRWWWPLQYLCTKRNYILWSACFFSYFNYVVDIPIIIGSYDTIKS